MKRALVTGFCGFVGRHLTRRLVKMGVDVVGVDDLSTGIHPNQWPAYFRDFDPPYINARGEDIRSAMRDGWLRDFDTIFHLAAVVGGRLKIEGDPLAVATDLSIDAEFFNWVVRLKPRPKKVVYFSSSAVYPTMLQKREFHVKLAEGMVTFDTPVISLPDMTYGWSKLSGEYLARFAAKHYGLDVVIYRPFSGYGEGQSLDYPFPSIVKRVVDGDDPVTVWGSGFQERDFIHIDDVLDTVFASMDNMRPGAVLNIGSGVPTSFMALANTAWDVLGCRSGYRNLAADTSKPEGVFSRVADVTAMNYYYRPKISLEDGIRRVATYLEQEHGN